MVLLPLILLCEQVKQSGTFPETSWQLTVTYSTSSSRWQREQRCCDWFRTEALQLQLGSESSGEFGKTHRFLGSTPKRCWYNRLRVKIPHLHFNKIMLILLFWDTSRSLPSSSLSSCVSVPIHPSPAYEPPFVGPLSISTCPCLCLRLEPFAPD